MSTAKRLSVVLLWSLLGAAPAALAGLVSTESVVPTPSMQAREQLKELVQRPELAKELESLGIPPAQAQERVDGMTDAEVLAMKDKLGTLPAGGALSNNDLILILLIVILIIAL